MTGMCDRLWLIDEFGEFGAVEEQSSSYDRWRLNRRGGSRCLAVKLVSDEIGEMWTGNC